MNSSIQTINTKEGLHADAISKTAPKKRTDSRKNQTDITQTIRSSAGGFFSSVRQEKTLTKGVVEYGIYSLYRRTKTTGQFS